MKVITCPSYGPPEVLIRVVATTVTVADCHETYQPSPRGKGLVETGALKPVTDKTYSFDEIVDAHRYVDNGHKKGSVVVTVG